MFLCFWDNGTLLPLVLQSLTNGLYFESLSVFDLLSFCIWSTNLMKWFNKMCSSVKDMIYSDILRIGIKTDPDIFYQSDLENGLEIRNKWEFHLFFLYQPKIENRHVFFHLARKVVSPVNLPHSLTVTVPPDLPAAAPLGLYSFS